MFNALFGLIAFDIYHCLSHFSSEYALRKMGRSVAPSADEEGIFFFASAVYVSEKKKCKKKFSFDQDKCSGDAAFLLVCRGIHVCVCV